LAEATRTETIMDGIAGGAVTNLTEMMTANGVVVMTATGRGTAIHIVRTIGRSEAV
jgi:hypothetical protein